jgi:hypothetical protein
MAQTRKTARQKLAGNHGLPKVVRIPPRMRRQYGNGKMVVPSPRLVDSVIRKVEKGKLITPRMIRDWLARDFRADFCCPMTTGIFLRLSAEAAAEDSAAGKTRITPWWRVVKDDGGLMEKFPNAPDEQEIRLQAEGFVIERKKGKSRVRDFQKLLMEI